MIEVTCFDNGFESFTIDLSEVTVGTRFTVDGVHCEIISIRSQDAENGTAEVEIEYV
jgi:hypothetical protein